jgi:isochorismate synthase EntC
MWLEFLSSGAIVSLDGQKALIGWGMPKWTHQRPNAIDHAFFFPYFFSNRYPAWLHFANNKIINLNELSDSLKKLPSLKAKAPQWYPTAKEEYIHNFQLLSEFLNKGFLQKAVLYLFEKASFHMNEQQLKHSLLSLLNLELTTPLYLYGFWNEEEGMLGATPEILLLLDNNKGKLQTQAVAGTAKIGSESTLRENRYQYEHEIVVEAIKQSISPFGFLEVNQTKIANYSLLSHLITPINVKLKELLEVEEYVKALHPTPAVGAWPKTFGSAWLKDQERKLPRKRYGAPAGIWLNQEGKGYFYVAIRSMQWQKKDVRLYVGSGITNKNIWEEEWNEIQLKLQAIKKTLGLQTKS